MSLVLWPPSRIAGTLLMLVALVGSHGCPVRLRFVDGTLTETRISDAEWESIKLQLGLPEHAASVPMPTFK